MDIKRQTIQLPLKTGKESSLWVRADIEADRDDAGEVMQWRVVLTDITQQKKAQEDKKMLEDQLLQARKMESIGTLAGGIAHEFNNILAIIMGNTEILMFDIDKQSSMRENMEEIQTAGRRAMDIVRQVLTFSRHGNVKQEPLAMGPLVKEGLKLIRSTIPASIEIKQNISRDAGSVNADPTQISQLLINLCGNAADAMPDSSGVITIDLFNETLDEKSAILYPGLTAGPHVKLVVADTGCGMDRSELERIFDPFYTTKDVGKGTGIGLAAVHGIIKRHEGAVSIESKKGQGTRFSILFPACKDLDQAKTESSP